MINRLKNLFTPSIPETEEHGTNLIALSAGMLLLEVAWADHDISEGEVEHIKVALKELYELKANEIAQVINQARSDHESSVGIQQHTQYLTNQLTIDERIELLRSLWQVALFDGQKHKYEEHQIRKISDLLYLNHSDFIRTKHEVISQEM